MNQETACPSVVAKALQWIDENLVEFAPFRDGEAFAAQDGKRVIELATLLYCYVELTGDHDSGPVQRMTALLLSIQERRDFRDRLLRFPAEFVVYCDVYAVLRRLGHDDRDQRQLIQRVIDASFLNHSELVPHRMMDIRLSLEWGGFRHRLPSLEALCATSILGQVPCALYLDEPAMYALTHVIMFLYAYGTREGVVDPPAGGQDLGPTLSATLTIAAQEHHWDLLGELLLCWDCVGLGRTVVYEMAWNSFIGAQKDDGALPCQERFLARPPGDGPGKEEESAADSQRAAYFRSHYHTTIVAILAGSLHLSRARRAEPAPRPGDCAGLGEGGSHVISAVNGASKWFRQLLDQAERADRPRPEALCSILLGCWVCNSVAPSASLPFADIARRVWGALTALDDPAGETVAQMPPALRLIAAALLSDLGLVVRSLQEFLSQALDVLLEAPAVDAIADLSLCEKRVLLHSLGLHPPPARCDSSGVMGFARDLSLSAPASAIGEFLLRLHSFTAYGTQRVALPPDDLWIQELISGFASHFLRQYDFETGCSLLRSMTYLGLGGSGFDACLRYLSLHQRVEGSFGFFGSEEVDLRDELPGFVADLDLYLPVTVDCLITLAESGAGGWRLFAALPRVVAPPAAKHRPAATSELTPA